MIWTSTPTKWSNQFFDHLFRYEWELTKSPAGANQWKPKGDAGAGTVPDPHDPSKRRSPSMLTTDIALRVDPAYEKISRRFHENPDQLADAFARAWFKLTHRDMGPRARYLGPEVPAEELVWQDPIPAVDHKLIDEKDIAALKAQDSVFGFVRLSTGFDRLGIGVHLPWLRQTWRRERRTDSPDAAKGLGSQPAGELAKVLKTLEGIQSEFNGKQSGGKKVSLADLIVLAGCAGVEQAAKNAGHSCDGSLYARTHGCLAGTNRCRVFHRLEPLADGFRNYLQRKFSVPSETLLIDKAQLLTLTPPELTVLLAACAP